jgi:hypothetical protein
MAMAIQARVGTWAKDVVECKRGVAEIAYDNTVLVEAVSPPEP